MRAATGRPVKIRFRLEDEGGVLTDADASTSVTVTVKDGAGTQIANGTATKESTGVYAYSLAAQSRLDVLSATATATLGGAAVTLTETIRLVDRRVVPLSVLRQSDELSTLSLADFLRAVDEAEDWITSVLNFSPVLTGSRKTLRQPDYTARLYVPGVFYPQVPYALSRNGVAYSSTDLASMVVRSHALEFQTAYFSGSYDPLLGTYGPAWPVGVYDVHLAHGLTETPNDLARATRKLAEHVAKTVTYPDRATRIMTEASEIWFSTPDGQKRLTGLPEVDGVLMRYRIDPPFSEDAGAF